MRRGWHPERQAFVQHYRTDVLDASLLYMPLVGFISPMDPMWQSTLRAMDKELVSDSLVYRYNPEASPDGLQGSEGTFSICTFWYVDALARSGRLEDARLTFDKMLTYANHLGLFSEEIGPTRRAAGQLPPGVQPPLADHRGGEPRLPARPRRRYHEAGARVRRGGREVGAHSPPKPLSLRGEGDPLSPTRIRLYSLLAGASCWAGPIQTVLMFTNSRMPKLGELAAVAAALDAAEGQARVRGDHAVDEHGAGLDLARERPWRGRGRASRGWRRGRSGSCSPARSPRRRLTPGSAPRRARRSPQRTPASPASRRRSPSARRSSPRARGAGRR